MSLSKEFCKQIGNALGGGIGSKFVGGAIGSFIANISTSIVFFLFRESLRITPSGVTGNVDLFRFYFYLTFNKPVIVGFFTVLGGIIGLTISGWLYEKMVKTN